MSKDFVDLEKFRDMLREDPTVYPMYRSLKNGNKQRTKEQMDRAVKMNLEWADKLDRMIAKEKHRELTSCP